ncbi:uncharacterized protein LOC143546998 [Bidens hawaiensis]|uniref:uncharacterized protein LOC143546998 n=1 Tax=Bidens hawaiensis TaxID=980011 RepID=UPI00404A3FBC
MIKKHENTLEYFYHGIIKLYAPHYLRRLNWNDLQWIYESVHGLPHMIGSVDCMHRDWINCSTVWRGQCTSGDQKVRTASLQAIASYDIWVRSAFFSTPGYNNNINVLEASLVLEDYISIIIRVASLCANDNYYLHSYYLGE